MCVRFSSWFCFDDDVKFDVGLNVEFDVNFDAGDDFAVAVDVGFELKLIWL